MLCCLLYGILFAMRACLGNSGLPVEFIQSLFKTRDKVQQGNFGKAQGSFVVVWIPHERDQMRETNWAKGFMPLKEQRSDKKARLSMAFRPTCKIKQHGGKIVYPVPSYHEFWTETVAWTTLLERRFRISFTTCLALEFSLSDCTDEAGTAK